MSSKECQQECPANVSSKSAKIECLAAKSVKKECLAKSVKKECQARVSSKNVWQRVSSKSAHVKHLAPTR